MVRGRFRVFEEKDFENFASEISNVQDMSVQNIIKKYAHKNCSFSCSLSCSTNPTDFLAFAFISVTLTLAETTRLVDIALSIGPSDIVGANSKLFNVSMVLRVPSQPLRYPSPPPPETSLGLS
jgi:hypothetical protein